MLTETYLLWQALARAEIPLEQHHPNVKTPGKSAGPCLRIRLDADGQPEALESLADEEWPGLWTIMEGNHNSFPVVRLKEPLLDVPPDDQVWTLLQISGRMPAKNDKELRDALIDAIDRLAVRKLSNTALALWKRLRDRKAAELEEIARERQELREVAQLAHRFAAAAADPQPLMAQLVATMREQLMSGWTDGLDAAGAVLVGRPQRRDVRNATMNFQLAFDLDRRARGVYTSQLMKSVARALRHSVDHPRQALRAEGNHPGQACAFSGQSDHLLLSPFPKVRLPVLNRDFPLVSMFEEAACNKRYGLTGSLVVPVSEQTALDMQDALKYIVSGERKGMTWRGISSGKFDVRNGRRIEKQDLLIAYVDGKPNLDARVASLFGTDPGEQQKQFEIEAQAVCEALDGIAQEQPDSRLILFVLREASLGQAQVVLADSPSVQEVLDGARRWQRGAGNVPPIALPIPVAKGEKVEWRAPHALYPDQVVRLLAEEWVTDGTRANRAPGVKLDDVLDLMVRTPGKWEGASEHMLELTVRRTSALLIGVFGALGSDTGKDSARHWAAYPAANRETALRAASLLGILLDSHGRSKESYMDSPAFLLGRFLALADTLHREYCVHVRGGGIPPQLIGNALMSVARDRPEEALDRLGERLPVYKAWATRVAGGDSPLAKWTLKQMGDVASQLASSPLPTQTASTDRAELLLGYIARQGDATAAAVDNHTQKETDP